MGFIGRGFGQEWRTPHDRLDELPIPPDVAERVSTPALDPIRVPSPGKRTSVAHRFGLAAKHRVTRGTTVGLLLIAAYGVGNGVAENRYEYEAELAADRHLFQAEQQSRSFAEIDVCGAQAAQARAEETGKPPLMPALTPEAQKCYAEQKIEVDRLQESVEEMSARSER